MKQRINLTSGKKRVNKALQKISYISMAVFFILTAGSLSLIAYRLVLKNSYDLLDAKEQKLNSQLLVQVEKRDKILEIKSRLGEIRKVISSRAPVISRIETVSLMVPQNSQVTAINGTDLDMKITLESDSLSTLNDMIELRLAEIANDKNKEINKIEMNSFRLNPKTLLYTVTLGIQFK